MKVFHFLAKNAIVDSISKVIFPSGCAFSVPVVTETIRFMPISTNSNVRILRGILGRLGRRLGRLRVLF